MNKKIVAFLQARTDSTRLPKKVLKPLLGKPMIIHQLERIGQSQFIDELILLTSSESSDNELADMVESHGYKVYRGSKDNVLDRFYNCASELNLKDDDIVVRLTGDCPVMDSEIIDELIDAFLKSDCGYMANCVEPIYPDGLDVEVFSMKVLKEAYKNATKSSQKEHVTPYIRDSGLFKVCNLDKKPIHKEWRLTVDEPEDFVVIEKIYNHFHSNRFTFNEMVSFLENNLDILEINNQINRNEGYLKSLIEDKVQGNKYIKKDADEWFNRNKGTKHNIFTEYFMSLFSKKILQKFNVAEFGVGRANNINLLSHYVNKIDGYDGSEQSIEMIDLLKKRNIHINGKRVNLGSSFDGLGKYDVIIYGFFTYMISDKEFLILLENSKKMLKQGGYIFIYDFLEESNTSSKDIHNKEMLIYKRNLNFYLNTMKNFNIIDFRLYDNRHLNDYLMNDNVINIDIDLDNNSYNWTFSGLFKLKGNK